MKRTEKRDVMLAAILVAVMIDAAGPSRPGREGRIAIFATAAANEIRPMVPHQTTPPARDPEKAVEEEYQIARQRGTAEALGLFIARHPDSPLAETARADLRRIKR